ncbi:hypothetical protein DPMN_128699 [Dreissena polymorpha]|uniref:Uncharacterized protein n=1 Tax=Dreissena polymorpha TaxID=45954 RepID=A0A9D4H7P3_DREPO|nr:hypothetical protein DPMN_128699 [Dreissena polymorpha]
MYVKFQGSSANSVGEQVAMADGKTDITTIFPLFLRESGDKKVPPISQMCFLLQEEGRKRGRD